MVLAIIMAASVATGLAYAEELDVRFLPSKMVENYDGMMHVFAVEGGKAVPKEISDLRITSLDSSVLHIEKVREGDDFITEVSVRAGKPGTTKIYLAAPGFTSKEIPVTVYGSKNNVAKILLKVTPDKFTTSGSNEGYIAVELADEDGFPVIAKNDVTVSLSTANKDMIEFANSNLIIKKGEYYSYSKFFVKKSGDAVLYATSSGIDTQSTTVTIKKDGDLKVKAYIYPQTLSINYAPKGFIIVQLQDSSGKPVLAQNDVTVYYKVTDATHSETANYSKSNLMSTGHFQIPRGSYWGYTQYTLPKGIEGTYDISVSSQNPLSVETQQVKAVNLQVMDDKNIKFETMPILTTGNSELIGILYLEDESGNPVGAKGELMIKIDSSDTASLAIKDTTILRGDQAALVFGKTGHSASSDLKLRPVITDGQLKTVTVFGPNKNSLDLVATPLVPKVLSGTDFPLAFYLKDGDEITAFPESHQIFMSPNEHVELKPKTALQRDTVVLADATSLKKGTANIGFDVGGFKSSLSVESLSSDPSSLSLDHAKTIFAGNNDVFSVQILNSAGLPTYATNDVEVSLVVKNRDLIDIPPTITIEKGAYYVLFDAAPMKAGKTDVSLLSKELPLLSKNLEIISLMPSLTIKGPESAAQAETFTVTVSANTNGKPLAGASVSWQVDGGAIQISDPKTGNTGEALAAITPQGSSINVKATVSSPGYSVATITKAITVDADPVEETLVLEEVAPSYQTPEIFGFDPILISVPAAIIGAGFMLKKKGHLKIKK